MPEAVRALKWNSTIGFALCALAGILRMGFIASFISEPVLKGFIIGLALIISIGQVPALLGIEKPPGSFFEKLWGILGELGDIDGLTAVVGIGSLVVILVLKRYLPLVPASLVVVLTGVAAVALFGLDDQGLDIVGPIEAGASSSAVPEVALDHYAGLVGPAVGVLLIGFAEELGAAKTYAAREGYDIDPNAELLGLSAANVGSGLFGGMVVNGSLSKTAVNGGPDAKSQVSGRTVAALTVVTLLFLTGRHVATPSDPPSSKRLYTEKSQWRALLGDCVSTLCCFARRASSRDAPRPQATGGVTPRPRGFDDFTTPECPDEDAFVGGYVLRGRR